VGTKREKKEGRQKLIAQPGQERGKKRNTEVSNPVEVTADQSEGEEINKQKGEDDGEKEDSKRKNWGLK